MKQRYVTGTACALVLACVLSVGKIVVVQDGVGDAVCALIALMSGKDSVEYVMAGCVSLPGAAPAPRPTR